MAKQLKHEFPRWCCDKEANVVFKCINGMSRDAFLPMWGGLKSLPKYCVLFWHQHLGKKKRQTKLLSAREINLQFDGELRSNAMQ